MFQPSSSVSIRVRWKDVDANRHVNNAVYLTYLEEARDAFIVGAGIARASTSLAHCAIDFLEPIPIDAGSVECSVELQRIGRSSIETTERISAGGTTFATAHSVSVHVDGSGRPLPVPDELRPPR